MKQEPVKQKEMDDLKRIPTGISNEQYLVDQIDPESGKTIKRLIGSIWTGDSSIPGVSRSTISGKGFSTDIGENGELYANFSNVRSLQSEEFKELSQKFQLTYSADIGLIEARIIKFLKEKVSGLANIAEIPSSKPVDYTTSGFNPDIGVTVKHESGAVNMQHGVSDTNGSKTPLGITPRKFHEDNRISEIMSGIERYLSEGKSIPEPWQDELNELLYDRIERTVEA